MSPASGSMPLSWIGCRWILCVRGSGLACSAGGSRTWWGSGPFAGRTLAFGPWRPTPRRWPTCHPTGRSARGGAARGRLDTSAAGVVHLSGGRCRRRGRKDRSGRPLERQIAATGARRPRPALHAAQARHCEASSAGTASARAHRRQGPSLRSVRFAALGLDAGSARATDGQLSDDASPRSRTLPPPTVSMDPPVI